MNRLKYYFKELIDSSIKKYGKLLEFIQYTLVYDLQWMVKVENIDDILDNIDDVLAVSFDTWLISVDMKRLIEFYHEGDITLGNIL